MNEKWQFMNMTLSMAKSQRVPELDWDSGTKKKKTDYHIMNPYYVLDT